jgi:hypothetical protein
MIGRNSLAALAAFVIALLFTGPALAKKPGEIAITPASPDAVLILKAESLPVPPGHKTSYWVALHTYDPAGEKMAGGPFAGYATFAARPKDFVDGYLVISVKPGTYAFQDVVVQDFWAVCFNGGSLQFTVKPGEVVYLGEMDVRRHVREIEALAVASGRTSTRNNNPIHFFDTVTPPTFAPIDDAQLGAVAAMVRTRMPLTTVAPRAVQFAPARFGTGRDLFGMQRLCGGYYQGKAKPAPAQPPAN